MSLYRFSTYRTSYYFPNPVKGGEFLFGLYHPYNSHLLKLMLVKMYWWLFSHCKLVRSRTKVKNADAEFPYSRIKALCPKGSLLSFNLGTPGPEQKISILGLRPDGTHFFAKFSQRDRAMALSKNEIGVLTALNGRGITPDLIHSCIQDDYVFFITSCVKGVNPTDTGLNEKVWTVLKELSATHLHTPIGAGLKTSLAHGDFTPWNMMVNAGSYQLIDWEMAGELPLGYDLFTYTLRQQCLMTDKSMKVLVERYSNDFKRYFSWFGINDYIPYLVDYAKRNHNDYPKFKELL